jgi:hypothetical protein
MRIPSATWPGWAPLLGTLSVGLCTWAAHRHGAHIVPAVCATVPTQPRLEEDEHAVLGALMDSARWPGRLLVVGGAPLSSNIPDLERFVDDYPPLQPLVVELTCALATAAPAPAPFTPGAWLGPGERLVSAELPLDEAIADMGACPPDLVCDRGPPANYVGFSTPVLSRDLDHALVYQVYVCGVLCASGDWILLERQQVGWVVVGRWNEWVS